jgi:hypothetical protein
MTLFGGAAAWPLAARAQAPRNVPRLCFLTFDPSTLQSNRFDPFFQGLRDLGYANGQNIAINYLSAAGDGDRFPALAAECLRLKADVIAVSTTPAAQAAIAPPGDAALGFPTGKHTSPRREHPQPGDAKHNPGRYTSDVKARGDSR